MSLSFDCWIYAHHILRKLNTRPLIPPYTPPPPLNPEIHKECHTSALTTNSSAEAASQQVHPNLTQTSFPKSQVAPEAPPPKHWNKKTTMSILSDSMLRGVDKLIPKHALEIVGTESNGGVTASRLAEKVVQHARKYHPDILVLHCGTKSVTKEASDEANDGAQKLLSNALWVTDTTKVIISGIIHQLDNTMLNKCINALNDVLEGQKAECYLWSNNATFKSLWRVLLKDGIHLSAAGKRQVADNLQPLAGLESKETSVKRTR